LQCLNSIKETLDCPSVEDYLELVDLMHVEDPSLDTIILTSEDPALVANFTRLIERRRDNPALNPKGRPVWRIVRNVVDLMQGSGNPDALFNKNNKFYTGNKASKDDIFMSFYSSFLLQMRARYFLLNCGSNFHNIIRCVRAWGFCVRV
jgi:hypothetical protein